MAKQNYMTPVFRTPLRMEPNRNPKDFSDWDGRSFRLTEKLQFADSTGTLYTIPEGFIFNGATTRPAIKWMPEWLKSFCQFIAEMFINLWVSMLRPPPGMITCTVPPLCPLSGKIVIYCLRVLWQYVVALRYGSVLSIYL